MQYKKRVLVTGHRGYIGPHLVELLKLRGHHVTGVDLGLFDDCAWFDSIGPDEERKVDFRSLTAEDLAGYDCIMHLAAISNDPMGVLAPELTKNVNYHGSVHLAKMAKEAGVQRFLFSSSCSVYGKGGDESLDENAALLPLSVYAESKILTEQSLTAMADNDFCPVFLRNATAYGHSPMFRVDLVVNNLLACAFTKGAIQIKSDGTPWRPLIHCRDIAHAFIAFLEAPREIVFNRAFNIGLNKGNYRVREIADLIQQEIPQAKIEYTGEAGNDPRNYRVDFTRLAQVLPDFKMEYSLSEGIRTMLRLMKEKSFVLQDFEGERFTRVSSLKKNIHKILGGSSEG